MAIIQAINTYFKRAMASDFGQKVAESFFIRAALIVIGLVTSVIVTRSSGPDSRRIDRPQEAGFRRPNP